MKTRARTVSFGVLAVLAAALVAGGGYRAYRMYQASLPILPEYVEPGDGPRAPQASAMGFVLGSTGLSELGSSLNARGIVCTDASASLLARRMRETKLQRLDREGLDELDGVSRASLSRPSRHERNPQVRHSCEGVAANVVTPDVPRVAGEGRLLAVFDQPTAPLRSISYQRTLGDEAAAARDLLTIIDRYRDRYGAPTRVSGPDVEAHTIAAFPRFVPVGAHWVFADLEIHVTGTRFGSRGVSMDETVAVPWPVRPDAPRDGHEEREVVELSRND